jgi:2-hydroxy-3-keto-5-methylthiopentenyl-1-phosphate phosphatase
MRPVVALLYDFDKTLGTKDMQEFEFIPSLSLSAQEFWQGANDMARREGMDGVLAYMYYMLTMSKAKNKPIKREELVQQGKSVELFDGVEEWFDRINAYGEEAGVKVEHYVLSSGLKEMIEGTPIADKFTKIYASEFLYDENGEAVWPKLAVNYTAKTQFVYRINKGVLDISMDKELNESMPDSTKRVRFTDMIYIGDGLTDVPCMKLVRSGGGTSIALYSKESNDFFKNMLRHERVDYVFPADYKKDSPLDSLMKKLLVKLSIDNALEEERKRQRK